MFKLSFTNLLIRETTRRKSTWLLLAILILTQIGCNDQSQPVPNTFVAIPPAYRNIHLIALADTLHFPLAPATYNEIKSFNYFIAHNKPYISFYDRRSESVNIYDFQSCEPVKMIRLKKKIKDKRFYKTSVYTKNFDSIYVTNLDKLYLIDSSGKIYVKTQFLGDIESMAYYETPVPPVIKNNMIYMGVRPFVKETSLKAIGDWKVLCGFDLTKEAHQLHYPLPAVYRKGLYGRRFLQYSYCYNNRGNFVFSFPADCNIYETNLSNHHLAYLAKSKLQTDSIEPVSSESLEKDEGGKEFALRDSYGPIYFDPHTKRYLRLFHQKVSKEVYESKSFNTTNSFVVLDEHFKIIGEFPFTYDCDLDTIFFTLEGRIYAQVNKKDENRLHFIQLAWIEGPGDYLPLTKK